MSRIYDALRKAEEDAMRSVVPGAPRKSVPERSPAAAATAAPAGKTEPHREAKAEFSTSKRAAGSVPASTTHVAAPALSVTSAQAAKNTAPLRVFCDDGSELRGAEEFRRLRTKLQQLREKSALRRLLIASALPGEGKTFVSVNLAHAFTMQHEARVLIVDADFRKPHVHEALNVVNEHGLSDYLEGRCGEDQLVHSSSVRNLSYIPAGPISSRPAELAASPKFAELIASLSERFEWVIIDSSPVIPVSDAAVVARICDGTLLVVSAGHTSGDLAQAAQRELKHANVLGVVLNRVKKNSAAHYGGYHYYDSYSSSRTAAAGR
jgi:capsular exopolysaccharide synthesis family protein